MLIDMSDKEMNVANEKLVIDNEDAPKEKPVRPRIHFDENEGWLDVALRRRDGTVQAVRFDVSEVYHTISCFAAGGKSPSEQLDELRAWLVGRGYPEVSRRAAVRIAEACVAEMGRLHGGVAPPPPAPPCDAALDGAAAAVGRFEEAVAAALEAIRKPVADVLGAAVAQVTRLAAEARGAALVAALAPAVGHTLRQFTTPAMDWRADVTVHFESPEAAQAFRDLVAPLMPRNVAA